MLIMISVTSLVRTVQRIAATVMHTCNKSSNAFKPLLPYYCKCSLLTVAGFLIRYTSGCFNDLLCSCCMMKKHGCPSARDT